VPLIARESGPFNQGELDALSAPANPHSRSGRDSVVSLLGSFPAHAIRRGSLPVVSFAGLLYG